MKITITKMGLILEPETEYDNMCIAHLIKQTGVTLKYSDEWNQTGNLILDGKHDEWGT